jgi:membrane glycosyltransferase
METADIPANCRHYLDRLALSTQARADIEAQLVQASGLSPADAMRRLHAILAGNADDANPARSSIAVRTRQAIGEAASVNIDANNPESQLSLAPPLNRGSMVPVPWGPLNPLVRWLRSGALRLNIAGADQRRCAADRKAIRQHGGVRRLVLLLTDAGTDCAGHVFHERACCRITAPSHSRSRCCRLFALLFCWVSAGFWTAMTGFLVLTRGKRSLSDFRKWRRTNRRSRRRTHRDRDADL